MKCLVLDTETTGLPKNRKGLITDNDNWPYIVQLAWILFDMETKTVLEMYNYIIKIPILIPKESTKIHGITNENMENYGIKITDVLSKLSDNLDKTDYMVAHNLSFDWNILRAEFYRNGFYKEINIKCQKFCTMLRGEELYRFRDEKTGRMVKKWPKLHQLHKILFKNDLNKDKLHDALIDVCICLRCFYKMERNEDILKDCIPEITNIFKNILITKERKLPI